MKSIYSKLVLFSLLMLTMSASVSARECIECMKTNTKSQISQSKAAACKRAQSTAELNINNVRALINGYGNMWYDGSVAQYHLPKNSNTCPLFCAALWIGGTDVNDQLRIAALKFGSEGDDYWPGPLKINGTAAIDLPVCNAYDKHWIITKSQVLEHKAHFIYGDDPADHYVVPNPDNYAEYQMPDVINNWPAKGQGEDLTQFLAPFYDADGDLVYNPSNGDYPYYDFDNDLCPRTLKAIAIANKENYAPAASMEEEYYTSRGMDVVRGSILSDQVLKGDQTIWWVFNDMGNTHTETKGSSIGLEIRAQAFAFSTNDEINNMTFYSYEIINRSSYELRETYFSQWVDPDLGYAWDDFVGCDVRRGLGYCYNGKSQDTPGSGSYSGMPPAVGIDFFQGPYMDPDGKDNPKIDIDKIIGAGYTNAQVKQLLNNYKMKKKVGGQDSLDARGRQVYDTISISDDADLFYAYDPLSWYFHEGDAVGNCAINGVNFGNNIIDDERFGMRRFVYYDNSTNNVYGEPSKASDYYNYLRGFWKNGQRMQYGGNAVSTGVDPANIPCDFMFPDNSDPWHWGTDGIIPTVNPMDWTEVTAGNSPGDRRFMQSAGPFTLRPGALNYITVGIPFAQATSGEGSWASVEMLRQIDDICQALFENCFKVLDGPDAPTLTCQEMSNEVILYLTYEEKNSNNYKEKYREIDPAIPANYIDENGNPQLYDSVSRSYIFEGYQVYQLKDANVSIADISDPSKARLVYQCDIENYYDTVLITPLRDANDSVVGYDTSINETPSLPIGTLVNYTTNSATGLISGTVMVEGANKGIQHVIRLTTDAFASGTSTKLVNNREYYYIAIAYAQNRFKEYSQTDPAYLDGQKEPYLAGRMNEKGDAITPITVIPHDPSVENGGVVAQSEFGMCPNIIRKEGFGNGGSVLRLDVKSIEELMGKKGEYGMEPGYFKAVKPGVGEEDQSRMQHPCMLANPVYQENYGPINVRVIDPLKLKAGRYNIYFKAYNSNGVQVTQNESIKVDQYTRWFLIPEGTTDTIPSDFTIGRYNEQLFLDLGIAVTLVNVDPSATTIDIDGTIYDGNKFKGSDFGGGSFYGGFVADGALLGSSMSFEDPYKAWLSGVPDNDSYYPYNWIRSGTQYAPKSYSNFNTLSTKYDINVDTYLDEDFFKGWIDPRYSANQLDAAPVENSGTDKTQMYESVVDGLWAPYGLVSTMPYHPGFSFMYYMASDHILDSIDRQAQKDYNKYKLERMLMVNSKNLALNYNELAKLPSVRIVLTSDTTKWTRCPVIEMCEDYMQAEGNARRFSARKHPSVDKLGRYIGGEGDYAYTGTADVNNPSNPAYIADSGMGWFPGYAINTVTGERLNIMFGEDSRFVQHNGRDMMWNPTDDIMEGTENYVMGGRHYVYVMNATKQAFYNQYISSSYTKDYYKYYVTPSYDAGRWAMSLLRSVERFMKLKQTGTKNPDYYLGITQEPSIMSSLMTRDLMTRDSIALLYASAAWVNMPLVSSFYTFKYPGQNATLNAGYPSNGIPTDAIIDIDVRMPYSRNMSMNNTVADSCGVRAVNRNMPFYQFVINESDAVKENVATRDDARQTYIDSILSLINVVPNPYYSYSDYETASQLETKVRICNLPTGINEQGKPEGCYIRIYTTDGTLVRTLGPAPVGTSNAGSELGQHLDWDLHNQTGIPIAGGVYLIHVTVPGIGERVIKWFGTMRPVDLNSFGF